jgi:hypothetical protein
MHLLFLITAPAEVRTVSPFGEGGGLLLKYQRWKNNYVKVKEIHAVNWTFNII